MSNILLQTVAAAGGGAKAKPGKDWTLSTEITDRTKNASTSVINDVSNAFLDGKPGSSTNGKTILLTDRGMAYYSQDGTMHNLVKIENASINSNTLFLNNTGAGNEAYVGWQGYGNYYFRLTHSQDLTSHTVESTNTVEATLASQFGSVATGTWNMNPRIEFVTDTTGSIDTKPIAYLAVGNDQNDWKLGNIISFLGYNSNLAPNKITLSTFVCPIGLRGSANIGTLLFDYTNRFNYNLKKIMKAWNGSSTVYFFLFDNGYISTANNLTLSQAVTTLINWGQYSFSDATPAPKRGFGKVRYVEGLNKFVALDPYAVNPLITSTTLTSWSNLATPQTYSASSTDRPYMNYGNSYLQAIASDATGTNIVAYIYGTYGGRWLVSNNGGATWSGKNRTVSAYDDQWGPIYCMFTGSSKFISIYNNSIALSTDNGNTFSDVVSMGSGAGTYYHTNLLAYSGNQTGSPGTILVMRTTGDTYSSPIKYYRSTNGGSSWTEYSYPWTTGVTSLCWDPITSKFLCVPASSANDPNTSTVYRRYFYESADGITWTRTSAQVPTAVTVAHAMIVVNGRYYFMGHSYEMPTFVANDVNLYISTTLAGIFSATAVSINLESSNVAPRHDLVTNGTLLSIGGIWGSSYGSYLGFVYIDTVNTPTTLSRYSTSSSKEFINSMKAEDMTIDGTSSVLVVGGTPYLNGYPNSSYPDKPGIYSVPMNMNGSSLYSFNSGFTARYVTNSQYDTFTSIFRNPTNSGTKKYLTYSSINSLSGQALYYWSGTTNEAPVSTGYVYGGQYAFTSGSGSTYGFNYGLLKSGFLTAQQSVYNYFQKVYRGGHTPYYNLNSEFSDFANMSEHTIQSIASNGKGVVVYKTVAGPYDTEPGASYALQYWCLAYPNATSINGIRLSRSDIANTYYKGYGNYSTEFQRYYRNVHVVWDGNRFYTVVGSGANVATKRAAYSTDGVNWTYANLVGIPTNVRVSYLLWSGSKYMLFFENTSMVYYSTDGINYTSQSVPAFMYNVVSHAFRPNDDGFNNTGSGLRRLVVAGGNISATARFFYSDDHVTWTQCTQTPSTGTTEIGGMMYSSMLSKYLAVERGNYDSNYAAYIWESVDGITWTRRTTQTPQYRIGFSSISEYIDPTTSTGYIVLGSSYWYNTMVTQDLETFDYLFGADGSKVPGMLSLSDINNFYNFGAMRGFTNSTYPMAHAGGYADSPNKMQKAYGKMYGGFLHVLNTGTKDTNFTGEYGSSSGVPLSADILVVGGGGGGGAAYDSQQKTNYVGCGGGGGAGGYVTAQNFSLIKGQSYQVTVGSGGAGFTAGSATGPFGAVGGTSYFRISPTQSQLIAYGGLGGGNGEAYNSWPGQGSQNQQIGGSAGGSAGNNSTNAVVRADVTQQLIKGGGRGGSTEYNEQYRAGGGGGAGGTGGNGGPIPLPPAPGVTSGNGGAGLSWLDGNTYAGGGGGALNWGSLGYATAGITPGGNGGSGVGGAGATPTWNGSAPVWSAPGNGTVNTGSGGGGAGGNNDGGNGAKGVVVLRIPTIYDGNYSISVDAALTYTNTTAAGYRYYRFTDGTGNITFN